VEIILGESKPSFTPRLTVPIMSKGQKLGDVFLGPRLSGEDYDNEDLSLLTTLTHQIAVTVENIELYQKLVRSENLATLGTMAAGMAHEIKNPLAAIKGMTQVLPENLGDKEFIKDYTELVPRQLDRINKIVENLLKAGRQPRLEKKATDLNQLLGEVLDFHENLCRQRDIIIRREFGPLPELCLDREQFQQVFINIIINAVQAMPKGGQLLVKSALVGDKVMIKISDNGVGIEADQLGKIFDPFFSLKEEGTGLGLFTAFRIIQEHEGSFDVDSQVGKGTRFSICLPIKPKQSV
jgi:signal transduction histidine kinase